eukprot:IDg17091t1
MAHLEDPRRNVGTVVFANVEIVTSEIDCKRYFGRLWKSTYVIRVNGPNGNTFVTQQIETRQAPAVETDLNLPRYDLENITKGYTQISETHREQVSSHGVDWIKADVKYPNGTV